MPTGLERDDQAKQARLGQSFESQAPRMRDPQYTNDPAAYATARAKYDFERPALESKLYTDPWQQLMAQRARQGGVQVGGLDMANQAGARQYQTQTIQDLLKAARGDPNSYAQQQLRAGMGQARGNVSTLGAAVRGQGAGAAMRGIGATQAGLDMQQQQQARILQVQEQQAATQALLQALQQQRQQDVGLATDASQFDLARTGEADRALQGYLGLGVKDSLAGRDADVRLGSTQVGLNLQAQQRDSNLLNQAIGAGAGGLSTLEALLRGGQSSPAPGGGYAQAQGDRAFYGR